MDYKSRMLPSAATNSALTCGKRASRSWNISCACLKFSLFFVARAQREVGSFPAKLVPRPLVGTNRVAAPEGRAPEPEAAGRCECRSASGLTSPLSQKGSRIRFMAMAHTPSDVFTARRIETRNSLTEINGSTSLPPAELLEGPSSPAGARTTIVFPWHN